MNSSVTVDAGGVRLFCRTWGDPDAPPMVLLHGMTADGSDWTRFAAAFADRWRIYAPDLRGHGRSTRTGDYSFELMRDDVIALLDALGLTGAALIGHSMGGGVAYQVALTRPDLVSRLVLEEAPPPVPMDRPALTRPAEALSYDWALVNALRAQLRDPDPAWRALLPTMTVPTLIIGSGPTSQVPQEPIASMAREIPGGTLATVPVGHLVHDHAHDEFCALVEEFLRG